MTLQLCAFMPARLPAGVWEAVNVLDASYGDASPYDAQTLSIDVQDTPGVLNHVTAVMARRGYNVQSLAVGNSEVEGRSRITTVIPMGPKGNENLVKQVNGVPAQLLTGCAESAQVLRCCDIPDWLIESGSRCTARLGLASTSMKIINRQHVRVAGIAVMGVCACPAAAEAGQRSLCG